MIKAPKYLTILIPLLFVVTGCGSPFGGILNTGGTNDPRKLISIAHDRMYRSGRIIGARNVLRRAIEQSEKSIDSYALAASYNMMAYTYIAQEIPNHQHAEIEADAARSYYLKAKIVAKTYGHECELIHTYIGMSLTNKILGAEDKACKYRMKGERLANSVKARMKENPNICEYGEKAIKSAEKRVMELNSHLNCNNG